MSRAYRLTSIQKLFIQQRLSAAVSQQNHAIYSLERMSGLWTRSILFDSYAMQSIVVQRQLLHTSRKQYVHDVGLMNVLKALPTNTPKKKFVVIL